MDTISNELLNSNDMDFIIQEYMNDQGKIIPKTSLLTIENNDININLTFETQFVHHQGLFTRYFRRLFVKITGNVTFNGICENIDMYQFIEQVRFQ